MRSRQRTRTPGFRCGSRMRAGRTRSDGAGPSGAARPRRGAALRRRARHRRPALGATRRLPGGVRGGRDRDPRAAPAPAAANGVDRTKSPWSSNDGRGRRREAAAGRDARRIRRATEIFGRWRAGPAATGPLAAAAGLLERAAYGGYEPDPSEHASRRGVRARAACGSWSSADRRPPAAHDGVSATASSKLAPRSSKDLYAMSARGRLHPRAPVSRPSRP